MKKVNLLSKAEMRKVMGGNAPTACETYAANNYTYPDAVTCFNCNYPDLNGLDPDEQTMALNVVLSECERRSGSIPPITPN